MKITIAQLNPIVGNIDGNLKKVINTLKEYGGKTDLIVFSELFLVGYPPKDLLEREWFIAKSEEAIKNIMEESRKYSQTGILLGVPQKTHKPVGKGLYNSALLIQDGEMLLAQNKTLLPTYDVFDETRYFEAAEEILTVRFKDEVLGIMVCEDAWNSPLAYDKKSIYTLDPVQDLAEIGTTIFINISASPFFVGKEEIRMQLFQNHVQRFKSHFIYVNQVGANDELIFDGRSMCFNKEGKLTALGKAFAEDIFTIDTNSAESIQGYTPQEKIASIHDALVLGIQDYLGKSGFKRAIIGLSGGIDSALTCALAVKALGRENVLGISMPSQYSSEGSVEDSRKLAENLGIDFKIIPIKNIFDTYLASLAEHFVETTPNEAEENIQARIRGNILMAFSNKFGALVLTTGNKSELAVGYCTLYGDMSGGLSVISDVPKTVVYKLSDYINREKEIIPKATIEKAPSAELRPDQKDQDTLPPYHILDEIINYYVEEGLSVEQIVEQGFEEETVKWIVKAIERNEYKRKQAPPGLKVKTKAFGVGRRMPIVKKV